MAKSTGIREVQAAFKLFQSEIVKKQKVALKLAAQAYSNDVRLASPYRHDDSGITGGTYRRSIHPEVLDAITAVVGSNLPYGKRLEYGFVGADSLGRVYNQPAQPHFRPTMDKNEGKYKQIYAEAIF